MYTNQHSIEKFKKTSLILIAVYILCAVLKNIFNFNLISQTWALDVVVVVGIISIFHSVIWYGKKNTLLFFAITFVVAWCFESLSIKTGFPFGHYHYTDTLKCFKGINLAIGQVPVIIMPAYFSVGYLSWVISHIFCNRLNSEYAKFDVLLIPAVAAFVMTIWDVTFDPLSSTVTNLWVWEEGGAYFGVPLQNFAGWYFCVFTIYLLFFLFIKNKSANTSGLSNLKSFWVYPTLTYLFFSADAITRPFRAIRGFDKNLPLPKDYIGNAWMTYDIYYALALISVFTMVFVGILSLLFVYRVYGTKLR